MQRYFKTRTTAFIVSSIALLVIAYAIAGSLIAPKLIRSALLKDIPATIGVVPSVGDIRINPFLMQATVSDFSLHDRGGGKLFGFRRLFLDIELSSLWHRAYTFAAIDIDEPFIAASVSREGRLNLSELQPTKPPEPKPQPRAAPLPAIRVAVLKVTQGLVTYADHSRPDEFSARLEPIEFELRNFTTGVTTGARGGSFTFTGTSKLGEKIEWHGRMSVNPLASDGEIRVTGLRAHTLWEYLENQLNFRIGSGRIDLAANYKFTAAGAAAGAAPALTFKLSQATLTDLRVQPKGLDADWLTVPSLTVSGATLDLAEREARVQEVSVSGLSALAFIDSDGAVNLMSLAAPTVPADTSGAKPVPVLATNGAPARPWRFSVQHLQARDADLSLEDRRVSPAVKLQLSPLGISLDDISDDLSKPLTVDLQTRIDTSGFVAVNGQVVPQPAAADLSVKLSNFALAALQPYLSQHTGMSLKSGAVSSEAQVHYEAQRNSSGPALRVSGDVHVADLRTVDNVLQDDFVNWARVDALGVKLQTVPARLDIERIVMDKLYNRVIIESDASLNIKRVLTGPGPSTSATSARMPVSIGKILVHGSQTNFSDFSIQPNFTAAISSLEGSIAGLSTDDASRATVNLRGSVGDYSPVTIDGQLSLLGSKLFADIVLGFHNIELTVFNPYSGKFAGYSIAKGKLDTDLHYKINGRQLDAQHHIVVNELEFGDKTSSKDAVSLPIKLAVALLKDRRGVIDLTVPVTGSLDDPQFRLGSVVWRVCTDILERAVTSPFTLLSSWFSGSPDIQYIDFKPGASTLEPDSRAKVNTVAQALVERPQLNIDVPIGVVPEVDRPALAAARFTAELAAAQAAQKSSPLGTSRSGESVRLDLLTQVYAQDFGASPKFPQAVESLKSKPEAAAARIDFLENAIREHVRIDDAELEMLGQQRAAAVQQVLLADPKVAAERVFLVANDKAAVTDGAVRLELTLR